MSKTLVFSTILTMGLAAAACAPRPASENPSPMVEPSGGPSAVPPPLPNYPHDPGYWV